MWYRWATSALKPAEFFLLILAFHTQVPEAASCTCTSWSQRHGNSERTGWQLLGSELTLPHYHEGKPVRIFPLCFEELVVFEGGWFNNIICAGFSVETEAVNHSWNWLEAGSASVSMCTPRSVDPRPTPQNCWGAGEKRTNGESHVNILKSCFG